MPLFFDDPVNATSNDVNLPAVRATNLAGTSGVHAEGNPGVEGFGFGDRAFGFIGGTDPQFNQHAGIYGQSDQQGVMGHGTTDDATGVFGNSTGRGCGVRGESSEGAAIQGRSFSATEGLAGRFIGNGHVQGNPGTSSGDLRVEGTSSFGGDAKMGRDVSIGGTLRGTAITCSGNVTAHDVSLAGGDCAEEFDTAGTEKNDPGTVMVIDANGDLTPTRQPYDKHVAGVISGASELKAGIVLDRQSARRNRCVIALLGKVYCKVDAQYSEIDVGDLLTTSPTLGYAMRASDPLQSRGSVIGKALRPLKGGQGLIPILIALQ
ncbi:MAG: hypothetical protein LAO78_28490 [Acidobacteriia bacterium]|nr:hypothetical protein [Terriglobia bacterium]